MKSIIARNFRILCDFMDVRDFMVEIYEKDWRNGAPAPFLEYALSSSWMDKSYTHKNRIWEANGKIVAFCYYENPINDVYFCLQPGYEELAKEMVTYAINYMPRIEDRIKMVLFEGQEAIKKEIIKAGYVQTGGYNDMIYDFSKPLQYSLPEGFRFVEAGKLNVEKIIECCWKGFDHEENEGPWDGNAESGYYMQMAPHATTQYPVAIESENGEYVCYAGMWWTPENNLAYMEPLCTVPEYRHKGLAAAALSELYHRMKPLGATHMTGGGNSFYSNIGYQPAIDWTFWEKDM